MDAPEPALSLTRAGPADPGRGPAPSPIVGGQAPIQAEPPCGHVAGDPAQGPCSCGQRGRPLPAGPGRQAALDLLLSRTWMTPVSVFDLGHELYPHLCPACLHVEPMRWRYDKALRRAAALINASPDLACLTIRKRSSHFLTLPKDMAENLRAQREMELRLHMGCL